MASKTFTVPVVHYKIVSVEENPKLDPIDSQGVACAWLVTYDKKFTNDDINNSGLSGVTSSKLWDEITKHAKEYIAEKFGCPVNQLNTRMYPGRGTVIVHTKIK